MLEKIRDNISKFRLHLIFAIILIYFAYHLINGDRGILALYKIDGKLKNITQELEQVRAERLSIEHKVNLLQPASLDLDLLDEQARKILGYASEDEIIILRNDKD